MLGIKTHAPVTLAGTPDYLTISGQVITRGTIDISDDTNLSAGLGILLTGDSLSFAPSELTTVTPATGDEFVLADVSDSENPKVATLSSMATAINSSLDHGTLAGLTDDDHSQYALLAGRSGGQTINGTTAGTNYFKITSAGKVEINSTSGQNNSLYHGGTEYLRVSSVGTTTLNALLYVTNGADFGYNYSSFDNEDDRVTSIRIPSIADAGASVLILDDFDEALFLDKKWTSVTYSTAQSSGKDEAPFRASADYVEWATFPGSGTLTITYDFSGAGQVIPANGNGYYQVGILTRFNTCVLSNLQVEVWDGAAYQTVYNDAITTDQLNNEWLSQRFLSPEPSYNFAKLRLTFTGTASVGVFRISRISIRHATSRQNNFCVNRAGDIMYGTFGVYDNVNSNQLTVGYNTSNYFTADVTSAGLVTLNAVGASSAFSFSDKVGIGTTTISANLHTLSTTEQLRVGYDASNYYSTTVGSTGAVAFDAVGSGAQFSFSDEVGIGTTTVSAKLHVLETTEQLRLGYDASNYYSTTVGSTGGVTFNANGVGAQFTFSDKILASGEVEMDGALNHDGTTVGFFGVTPATRQTELTDELTTITHTAPGTPDYAIQNLTNASGYGFVTQNEGNTVLSVIANLQTRVNEIETKLTAYGLFQDAD